MLTGKKRRDAAVDRMPTQLKRRKIDLIIPKTEEEVTKITPPPVVVVINS